MVQYIRGEGVELFERPKPPAEMLNNEMKNKLRDASKTKIESGGEQKSTYRDFETDTEWTAYCDWLQRLSKQSVEHFLRGIQIGVQLGESWLVSQGAAYVWNYLHHKIEKRNFNQLVPTLNECLDALRKVGHNNEPELLVAISVALANGLMQNWLPTEHVKSLQIPNLSSDTPTEKHARKAGAGNPGGGNPQVKVQFTLTNEAQNDIKKAIEVRLSFSSKVLFIIY